MSEAQTGFREGYCITDNIFVIDFLSKFALNNKKKLFCVFIDFKQTFDTVWRHGLWTKILKSGIDGKCLRFIVNLRVSFIGTFISVIQKIRLYCTHG